MPIRPRIQRSVTFAISILTAVASIFWLSYVGVQNGPSFKAPLSDWLSTLLLILAGIVPLFATLISLHNHRLAALLCFSLAVTLALYLSVILLIGGNFPPELLRPSVEKPAIQVGGLLFMFLLLVVPGPLWFIAHTSRWAPVLSKALSLRSTATLIIVAFLLVVISIIMMNARTLESPECHSVPQPFAEQQRPNQAVFTTRLLWTHLLWPSQLTSHEHPEVLRKYLGVARVETRFWGLPKWATVVLLTYLERGPDNYFQVGKIYFVDGRHAPGSISRFLPTFDVYCTRTALLTDAEVDLRAIHDGRPDGVRIMGRILRSANGFRPQPVPRVNVVIQGPSGRTVATSDESGVYDSLGLPPGSYKIGIQSQSSAILWQNPSCIARNLDQPVRIGDIRDCTIIVQ